MTEKTIEDFTNNEIIEEVGYRNLEHKFCDLTYVSNDDIENEASSRGLFNICNYSDEDFIDEYNARSLHAPDDEVIYKLYQSFLTSTKEDFDKNFKKFIYDTIDIIV